MVLIFFQPLMVAPWNLRQSLHAWMIVLMRRSMTHSRQATRQQCTDAEDKPQHGHHLENQWATRAGPPGIIRRQWGSVEWARLRHPGAR